MFIELFMLAGILHMKTSQRFFFGYIQKKILIYLVFQTLLFVDLFMYRKSGKKLDFVLDNIYLFKFDTMSIVCKYLCR